MDKNKRILKIGLVIISLSLIMSMAFALLTKVKNPVFLKNYIDSEYSISDGIYSECELILHYITNIDDDRYITDIAFHEAPPEMDVIASIHSFGIAFPNFYVGNSQQVYGRYKVNTVYIRMDLNNIETEVEDLELNNAKIFFDNGTNLDVDIGRVRFYKYEDGREYFGGTSSGSSSDGTGYMSYEILRNMTLLNVQSTLLDSLSDTVEVKIGDVNYKDIENVAYKKGNSISMNYHRNYKNDIMSQYISYNISPKLTFQDSNGIIHHSRMREVRNSYHDFSFLGILKYLRARGEI